MLPLTEVVTLSRLDLLQTVWCRLSAQPIDCKLISTIPKPEGLIADLSELVILTETNRNEVTTTPTC